jgi:branched-chain amino acid transport system substrate-binding protein
VFCAAATALQVPQQLLRSVAAASLHRVAVLIQDSLATDTVLAPFQQEAAGNGLDLVAVKPFQSSSATLADPLRVLIAAAPEAILIITPPPFNTRAVSDARALGWTGRLYCGPSAAYPDFIRMAGPAAEGVRVVAPWLMLGSRAPDTLPNSWAIQDFVQSFTSRYGPVGAYAGYGADAVAMVHRAYIGHRDRARAREILEHMTYVGATGVFRMTPANHAGLDDSAITTVVVRDGTWAADDDRP